MDELSAKTETSPDTEKSDAPKAPGKQRSILRIVGLMLITIAGILAIYGLVTYVAIQRGQAQGLEKAQQEQADLIVKQIELARGDIDDENFARAISRLDWVLEREPESEEALTLRAEAQAGLDARLHPTPSPNPSPVPTETAEVDGTPETGSEVEAEIQAAFDNLIALEDDGEWAEVISAISSFQQDFPNVRREETDEMLYNAYINLGIQYVSGTKIELGLFYLSQAEQLGDLPEEVRDHQTWAELYLQGIGYYGVDWETTIFYFRGLCAAAPFYQDACQKLFEAYVGYGDQFAGIMEWCPAEEWYVEAVRLQNKEEVVEKRREATMNCLEATPTPEAPLTNTVPITNTIPVVSTPETIVP